MAEGFARTVITLLLTLCFVFAEGVKPETAIIMQETRLATEVYISDSGNAGPTIVVIGGIHGNETAGILAADELSGLMPAKGTLVVVPRANKPACENGVRTVYYMEDLNRSFPGDKNGSLTQYAAAMLTETIAGYKPSLVIDLHESGEKYGEQATALGQALVISEQDDSAAIVLDILEGLNKKVAEDYQFTFASGAPQGSLNKELSKLLDIPAITVETWVGQQLEARIDNHIQAVKAILDYLDMLQ